MQGSSSRRTEAIPAKHDGGPVKGEEALAERGEAGEGWGEVSHSTLFTSSFQWNDHVKAVLSGRIR